MRLRQVSLSLIETKLSIRIAFIIFSAWFGFEGRLLFAQNQPRLSNEWKADHSIGFTIKGTGSRSNPLRRKLATPFDGNELFVRYRLKYPSTNIDSPPDGNGEFLVLWLDDTEGEDRSTHSSGVPNIGIHVDGNENRFMTRFNSGQQKFGTKLTGDREILLVARLWKAKAGKDSPFNRLDLWVDPKSNELKKPHVQSSSSKAISIVRWLGFSTGAKTEPEDKIMVWDLAIAGSWNEILGLPPDSPSKPNGNPQKIVRTIQFKKDIFPFLKEHCFECHAGDDPDSEIRLDRFDEVLNQTQPRNAKQSHLFQLVIQNKMPPESDGLPKGAIRKIEDWINEGLDWDESLLPTPPPKTDHWAFQPIQRPSVPQIKNSSWVKTPVDAFIAKKHESLGLVPAQNADSSTLSRRRTLDLIGLPPSQVNGKNEVDDLLSNPQYGVRWGRHWLDVARWAESNGFQHNRDRPYAWRYRDWVIEAFNKDKPYDEFVLEQIAGDELQPHTEEALIATGFLAAGSYSGNEHDKEIQRNDILVDIVNTTGEAFLGLTVGCAQCHTHKFDPISIRDYYRLQAFFINGQPGNIVLRNNKKNAESLIASRWKLFESVHDRLVNNKRHAGYPEPIYVIPKSVVGGMNRDEKKEFHELEDQIAKLPQSWSYFGVSHGNRPATVAPHEMRWPLSRNMAELKQLRASILIRGDVKSKGPVVSPGWPLVFGSSPKEMKHPRTELANWLTSKNNPLTARVWVNRIWQWHFGRGLVETSGDFGLQGRPPSHPKLLDFLACELMDNNWSTKHIHRLIMNSSTYQQSSRYSKSNALIDPSNRFLWRWPVRRLEAEAIRDCMLSVGGNLDLTMGGLSSSLDSHRRSVYLKQKRDRFPQQQILFDSANGITSCSRRRVSTNALQPLWLMNSDFSQEASSRLAHQAGSVTNAFELTLGRVPTSEEQQQLVELANKYGLASACLVILNSSEFLYIP